MVRQPKQQRSKATVDAIVEAALISIANHGPAATTARQIADLAGIGVGSLYEYFKDKDAIFNEVGKRIVNDAAMMIQPLVPELVQMDIREATHGLLFAFRDFLEGNDQLYLKCARHAFSLEMVVYQMPINTILMDFFTQYLVHHPEMFKLKNLSALSYFYIQGGVYTIVRHLSEDKPTQTFEELVAVFSDTLGGYVESKLHHEAG